MKENLIIALLVFSIGLVSSVYFVLWQKKQSQYVLAYETQLEQTQKEHISSPTYSLSPEPSATASPKPTPSPTPTITPSPKPAKTPMPSPTEASVLVNKYSSEQIYNFVERFAAQYSVSPDILRHIALCESGFNSGSVNGPYAGLYQFSINTWTKYRNLMGENSSSDLRLDAEEAVQTAAYVLSVNQAYIWPNCVP